MMIKVIAHNRAWTNTSTNQTGASSSTTNEWGTQGRNRGRGNNRQQVFFTDDDRIFYLETLAEQSRRYRLVIHGYCLMTNHVHVIATPLTASSLAKAIGRAHTVYSQTINEKHGRAGHLWQERFFSCAMDEDHTITALAYAECNPERAGLVALAWEYPWSSAAAHCGGDDPTGLLDLRSWRQQWEPGTWRAMLAGGVDPLRVEGIRGRTRSGRPLGSESFVTRLEEKLDRALRPMQIGRPRK